MICIDFILLDKFQIYVGSDLFNLLKERFEAIIFWKHFFVES